MRCAARACVPLTALGALLLQLSRRSSGSPWTAQHAMGVPTSLRPLPEALEGGSSRNLAPAWSRMQLADDAWPRRAASLKNASSLQAEVRSRRVHVITFADRPTVYLDALAASVSFFNGGEPLHVLGLSGRRSPNTTGSWGIARRSISGTDPGKLKKLWFLGALLDDDAKLEKLGFRETDLLLFLDAFDCIVQRPLSLFPVAWERLVRRRVALADGVHAALEDEAVVLLAEHSCWPWPLPGMRTQGRPRGVSMSYMSNRTFQVTHPGQHSTRPLKAESVCEELRSRSGRGLWSYPNSGVFAGSVEGVRSLLARLRLLVLEGHFEDQGMFHLAMLQHPRSAIRPDSNASLFASQYAYNGKWWSRPACFDDYFDASGSPPTLLSTGGSPFALHFNGPAGRYRLGWCIAALLRATSRPGQVYVDVDHDGKRVALTQYCDADADSFGGAHDDGRGSESPGQRQSAPRAQAIRGAAPPPGRRAARLSACDGSPTASRRPIACINDRCTTH
jgi:hypothetical protein